MTLLTEALRRVAATADDVACVEAPATEQICERFAPIVEQSWAEAAEVEVQPSPSESVATADRSQSGGVIVFVSIGREAIATCAGRLIDGFARTLTTQPSDAILILDAHQHERNQHLDATDGESLDQSPVAPLIHRWQRVDDLVDPSHERADGPANGLQVVRGKASLEGLQQSPVELLALLAECRSRFSWTLIDAGRAATPRLTLLADLARRCDALYVVLERRQTGRTDACRFLHALRRAGIEVAACLLVDGRRAFRPAA